MNDNDPLAPIEALLTTWESEGLHDSEEVIELREALTEARQAVDALVAEREEALAMAARFVQLLAGAAKESNAALSKMAQRIETALAQPATDEHECDAGHFDRTLCPEPCGAMHSYCATCGKRADPCAHHPATDEEAGQ